jgi:hypothetical protein
MVEIHGVVEGVLIKVPIKIEQSLSLMSIRFI